MDETARFCSHTGRELYKLYLKPEYKVTPALTVPHLFECLNIVLLVVVCVTGINGTTEGAGWKACPTIG